MRRVVGIDIHRTFGEVVIWEAGKLKQAGRVDMTRTALEGLGKSLQSSDEVVIEATGNAMAVSRVLSRFTGPQQARQHQGVPRIVLDPLTRPLRNAARSHDPAVEPECRELSLQSVAAGTGVPSRSVLELGDAGRGIMMVAGQAASATGW